MATYTDTYTYNLKVGEYFNKTQYLVLNLSNGKTTTSIGTLSNTGLQLVAFNAGYILRGTPTKTGTFTGSATTTWSNNKGTQSALGNIIVNVNYNSPKITSTILKYRYKCKKYEDTLVATGGGITWSIVKGQLPPGLTLDENTGIISGLAE